jgi:hypothetical protein
MAKHGPVGLASAEAGFVCIQVGSNERSSYGSNERSVFGSSGWIA